MLRQTCAIRYHVSIIAATGHKGTAENRNHQRARREGVALRFVKIEIQGGGRRFALLDSTAERDARFNVHLVENGFGIAPTRLGHRTCEKAT